MKSASWRAAAHRTASGSLTRQPVTVFAGAATARQRARVSAWVDELQAQACERTKHERARQRASEPVPASDMALFSGFILLVVALLLAGIALAVAQRAGDGAAAGASRRSFRSGSWPSWCCGSSSTRLAIRRRITCGRLRS